jgi:hypothetical protein
MYVHYDSMSLHQQSIRNSENCVEAKAMDLTTCGYHLPHSGSSLDTMWARRVAK